MCGARYLILPGALLFAAATRGPVGPRRVGALCSSECGNGRRSAGLRPWEWGASGAEDPAVREHRHTGLEAHAGGHDRNATIATNGLRAGRSCGRPLSRRSGAVPRRIQSCFRAITSRRNGVPSTRRRADIARVHGSAGRRHPWSRPIPERRLTEVRAGRETPGARQSTPRAGGAGGAGKRGKLPYKLRTFQYITPLVRRYLHK